MSARPDKGYKRSWRNLLLNKRYQLRFTLTMVGLSAALMGLLGWWVMTVANRATVVAVNNVLGEVDCRDAATRDDDASAAADPPPPPPALARDSEPAAAGPVETGKPVVTIEQSEMRLVPEAGAQASGGAAATAAALSKDLEECKQTQAAKIHDLVRRAHLIFWVLIAVGTMLVVGLLGYGIKMTHRVAGPLHKVTLYMGKLRDGTYDTVYRLRKGDHLVEFYEHFKAAHAGMKKWQVEDVARLQAVLAAADQAQLVGRSPEAAAAVAELRALLERKEKSLS